MAEYQAYFSVGSKGVHAHLLDLPGCFARGGQFEEMLARIPAVIQEYFETNGETPPESPRFRVIEVIYDQGGPFNPGDTAALFEAEKKPVSPAEVEDFLRFADGNRDRLLALVRELPENILDWQATPETFSIRRILRHIGNSEEWYVSRLVDPDQLPAEWEHDAGMPIFDFLEMERRTVFSQLRELTETQRSGEPRFPPQFTENPGEHWNARKALRRLLEHEREHTAQARDVLADWRRHFLARLSAERSWFLWQLRGLTESDLGETPVFEDWSAKDLLAHIGEWDLQHTKRLLAIAAENWGNLIDTGGESYYERENERLHRAHSGLPVETVVRNTMAARREFITAFKSVPDQRLFREYEPPGGERLVLSSYVHWRHRHDAMHGEALGQFRRDAEVGDRVGSKAVLGAILVSSLGEMLSLGEIVPPGARVTGDWTLEDVFGHLADWEQLGLDALRAWMAGTPAEEVGPMSQASIDAWNAEHLVARRGKAQAAADFARTRHGLVAALHELSEKDLAGEIAPPWGGRQRLYDFFLEWPSHDREHAAAVREALSLQYPSRLQAG